MHLYLLTWIKTSLGVISSTSSNEPNLFVDDNIAAKCTMVIECCVSAIGAIDTPSPIGTPSPIVTVPTEGISFALAIIRMVFAAWDVSCFVAANMKMTDYYNILWLGAKWCVTCRHGLHPHITLGPLALVSMWMRLPNSSRDYILQHFHHGQISGLCYCWILESISYPWWQ